MSEKTESGGYRFFKKIEGVLPSRGNNYEKLNTSFLSDPLFVEMMTASPTVVGIFSYESMTYEYFSPNTEEITGYKLEQLQGVNGAEFAINTFHPEQLNIIVNLMEVMKKYYYEYSLQNRVMDSRVTWTVLLRRADGSYIWTLQQTMVVEVTPEGFPLRVMLFISDITDVKTNSKIDFVFAMKNKDEVGHETIHISHYENSKEYVLTERELEILNCVSKGMRNHEIAEKLHISKHTVLTHRKNIMRKSGKDNIIQLLVQ